MKSFSYVLYNRTVGHKLKLDDMYKDLEYLKHNRKLISDSVINTTSLDIIKSKRQSLKRIDEQIKLMEDMIISYTITVSKT